MQVIDGDGHYLEPIRIWTDYVPATMRDRIRVIPGEDGRDPTVVLGDFVKTPNPVSDLPVSHADLARPGGLKPGRPSRRPYEEAEPGGFDSRIRLEMHDTEDIVAAVLFPTRGLGMAGITDPEVALAACQAVNNWAAEYASPAPDELYPVAVLPSQFPEVAVAELERCVNLHGFVGAMIRPNPTFDGRLLDDPGYDRLWSAAEDLDVPICVHNGTSTDVPHVGQDRCSNYLTFHTSAHPLEGMMAFATMFQGDVFTRHRRLRVGYLESGCGWAPFWLERLHEHNEIMGWLVSPPTTRDPLEVFIEQCVVGCEGEERMVPYVQDMLGDEKVIWASDFPHFDTEPPFTGPMLERDDMTEAQRDGVMRRAALSFYRLDWDRIVTANAQRRGISVPALTGRS